jgi:hypothetical protein
MARSRRDPPARLRRMLEGSVALGAAPSRKPWVGGGHKRLGPSLARVEKTMTTKPMPKKWILPVTALAITLLGASPGSADAGGHKRLLLAFGSLYGVDGPFLNVPYPANGVAGDEAAWIVGPSAGSLTTDGHLKISVRGLIFADGRPNDEATFRALVTCVTDDGTNIGTASVLSPGFPASPAGNSNIDAHLRLPNPCIDPIVMILAGSEDKWFAVNGFEAEE